MRVTIFLLLIVGALLKFGQQVDEPTTPKGTVEIQQTWTVTDSKAYAQDRLKEWQQKQWSCLNRLWGKESAWNPDAYNSIKVMGRNAGGIPQLLGLDPSTPAPRQIERGLDYIYYRYGTPCDAWTFFKKNGWH